MAGVGLAVPFVSGSAIKKGIDAVSNISKAEKRAEKLSKIDRSGKEFTKAVKEAVIDLNKAKNEGKSICVDCGVETKKAVQDKSGVPTPKERTEVDHINPKSKGGSGTPNNGDVRCNGCNNKKSDN